MRPIHLAIIGATGIVGQRTLDVLAEWNIPLKSLRLISSAGSAGQRVRFRGEEYFAEALSEVPAEVEVSIFATSASLSEAWVPRFREAGITVIDHSSHFRQHSEVPLVIPEINGDELRNHRGLIANPNCSASVMLLPLFALSRNFGLKQVIADSYQSVSGAGRAALDEMDQQFQSENAPHEIFPQRIAHNVIPEIGPFNSAGVTGEEQKIGDEIRKILRLPELPVLATAVRVPVHTGHSVSLTIQLRTAATKRELESALQEQEGMICEAESYRTPLEIAGRQEIFVGRLRMDASRPDWIQLWVVGDNLRKGAASNAIQILQELYK